jgi:hypothetical protein
MLHARNGEVEFGSLGTARQICYPSFVDKGQRLGIKQSYPAAFDSVVLGSKTVKLAEYLRSVLLRDSYAVILHPKHQIVSVDPCPERDVTVFVGILERVAEKVVKDLLDFSLSKYTPSSEGASVVNFMSFSREM